MRIILLIFIFTAHLISYSHPVHVSVTNFEYHKNDNKITLSIKLFKDDFTAAVNKSEKKSHHYQVLEKQTELPKAYIDYIHKNFMVLISGKPVENANFVYIDKRNEDLAVWLSFKIGNIKNVNELTIENKLLLNLYQDQTNLLIFAFGENEEGIRFDVDNTIKKIKIN